MNHLLADNTRDVLSLYFSDKTKMSSATILLFTLGVNATCVIRELQNKHSIKITNAPFIVVYYYYYYYYLLILFTLIYTQ